MKILLAICILLMMFQEYGFAQSVVQDQSLRYQQERMVATQWDQKKFTPKAGFLSLNPYYWLVWGLFHPSYHNTDRRPLSPAGPQTQRLALVAALNSTDNSYKLQTDTVRNTALSEIANQSGLITDADPLWQLYYRSELDPVINNSQLRILAGLSPQVSTELVADGLYAWYKNELDMLRERVNAAHSTTIDRGARIMAYHRYLMEYRTLAAVWSIRTASATTTIQMTASQQRLKSGAVDVSGWTPATDIQIANKVLTHIQ
jgi:hypothetical protein